MVKIYQDYKENSLSEENGRKFNFISQAEWRLESAEDDDAFSDLSERRAAGIKENL